MHRERVSSRMWDRCLLVLFASVVSCYVLQAYSFFGIPFPWIASVLAALGGGAAFWHAANRRLLLIGGMLMTALIGWYAVVNVIQLFGSGYAAVHTGAGTVPYAQFVGLRFFAIVAFFLFAGLAFHIVRAGYSATALRIVVWIGAAVSVYAVGEYFLNISGVTLFERTRAGAFGSGSQPLYYTYAFHRAIGTFLEPSHLGVFLIIPMLLALSRTHWVERYVLPVLMMTTLLLTGSLTAILSVLTGVATALAGFGIISGWRQVGRCVARFTVIAVVGWAIFVGSVRMYTPSESSLHQQYTGSATPYLVERASVVLLDGIASTNRGYIYRAVWQHSMPILGYGLGNAYVELARLIDIPEVASFLNLYLNALYSGGVVAVVLIVVCLLLPPWLRLLSPSPATATDFFVFAAYVAWLVVYLGLFDELHLIFAIPYALLLLSGRAAVYLVRHADADRCLVTTAT